MKKYGENMKKNVAVGIRRAKHRAKGGASRHIYLFSYIKALEFGIISSSPHIGSETWKNGELHPLCRL